MVAEELNSSDYQFTVHGEMYRNQGQLFLQLINKTESGGYVHPRRTVSKWATLSFPEEKPFGRNS